MHIHIHTLSLSIFLGMSSPLTHLYPFPLRYFIVYWTHTHTCAHRVWLPPPKVFIFATWCYRSERVAFVALSLIIEVCFRFPFSLFFFCHSTLLVFLSDMYSGLCHVLLFFLLCSLFPFPSSWLHFKYTRHMHFYCVYFFFFTGRFSSRTHHPQV